jgi:hypothetical protein
MKRWNQFLLLFAGPSLLFSVVLGDGNTEKKQHKECGIYLAESSIPGAGLGMFAGNRDYKEEEILTSGDLVVPVFEMPWHNGFHKFNVSAPILQLNNVVRRHTLTTAPVLVFMGRIYMGCKHGLGDG